MRASIPCLASYVTKLSGLRPCPLPAPPPPPSTTHSSTSSRTRPLYEPKLRRSLWSNPILPELGFDLGFRPDLSGDNSRDYCLRSGGSQHSLVRTIHKNLQFFATSESRDRASGVFWILLPTLVITPMSLARYAELVHADKRTHREVIFCGADYRCWLGEKAKQVRERRGMERTRGEIQEAALRRRKREGVNRRQGRLSLDTIMQLCTLEVMMQTC